MSSKEGFGQGFGCVCGVVAAAAILLGVLWGAGKLVGKSCFTCREWCRLVRIRAEKKLSGRGAYARWVVPHAELLRYQKEGLLPFNRS